MNDFEAKKLTNDVFSLMEKSKSISDINAIVDEVNIPEKYRMKTDGYPKIEFSINKQGIQKLKVQGLLNDENNLADDITEKINDPLTKLLYAIAWKNGDLKKLKYLINGVIDSGKAKYSQDTALVFYQFGRYLNKGQGEHIIDQHVLRAYAVFKCEEKSINKNRKIELIDKHHINLINDYKKWLKSEKLTEELKKESDYTYYLDQLLYATGKYIKYVKDKK